MTILEAAETLVQRATARGLRGHAISFNEMPTVVHAFGGMYPNWLVELQTTVPLCGLKLGWQEFAPEAGYDGQSWLIWSDARNVLSESAECYPGLAILPAGYINVASCSTGSGDPYFISAHEGVDPPLYRVRHDVGHTAEAILSRGRSVVATHLSKFLTNALL